MFDIDAGWLASGVGFLDIGADSFDPDDGDAECIARSPDPGDASFSCIAGIGDLCVDGWNRIDGV